MFLGQLEVNECRLEVGFFFRSGLLVLVCSSDMLDLQQLPGFVYVSVCNTMVFRSRQGGCGFDSRLGCFLVFHHRMRPTVEGFAQILSGVSSW